MNAVQKRLALVAEYWRETPELVCHRASALLALKRYDAWMREQFHEHHADLIQELMQHRERATKARR